MRTYVLVCVCLCLDGWGLRVHAQPVAAPDAAEAIALEWSAPKGCPDGERVSATLRERLRAVRVGVPLHARAQVTQDAQGYRLDLELMPTTEGVPAQRSLRNARCEPLAEAAVVLISLAVSASESAPEPQTSKPAMAPPASLPEPNAAPAPGPSATPSKARPAVIADTAAPAQSEPASAAGSSSVFRGPSTPLHLQLSAAARSALAVFPQDMVLGLQAQLAARIAPLYAAVGFSYWLPSDARSASYPKAILRGSGMFADVSLGADVRLGWFVLTPALCLELGRLDAQALGVKGPEASRAFWLAAGAAASLSFPLFGRWSVALDAAALSPLTRIRWLVRAPGGDVQAFTAAPFGARFGARVEFTFW